jgi:hypothetical protein
MNKATQLLLLLVHKAFIIDQIGVLKVKHPKPTNEEEEEEHCAM